MVEGVGIKKLYTAKARLNKIKGILNDVKEGGTKTQLVFEDEEVRDIEDNIEDATRQLNSFEEDLVFTRRDVERAIETLADTEKKLGELL